MDQLIIRPATLDDGASLFPIVQAFATSFAVDAESFYRSLARLVSDEHACLLVAEAGSIVGYLLGFEHDSFFANGPVGWVEELMVEEAQRRQRVGSRLMRVFERWAAERGCRLVALATRRAASFYRAIGYEESAAYFRRLIV